MILCDQHLHTRFSPDSPADMGDMCLAASQMGLRHICFTEHVDIGHANPIFSTQPNIAAYKAEIAKQRLLYPHLFIGCGLEVGFIQPHLDPTVAYLKAAMPLDVILWSVHEVQGQDTYDAVYFEDKTRQKAYGDYLETVLESVKAYDDWDILAHLGYVWKNAPLQNAVMRYDEFPILIDAILTRLIAMDKVLEINTSGNHKHGDCIPEATLLARYVALGGRIVSFGSDAHLPERVGGFFEKAAQMARDVGLTEYAMFADRKRTLYPI